ncbi:MAG: trypsin-like peptidase domain-containing protein [Clostridia bacterium]|nr:trypsin-like peptidase domain-containing protein [Clostridia bacterium]
MWSFDEEENKNETPENGAGTEEPQSPKRDDDFSERDPFSRGGDFYKSYSGGESGGNAPKKPKKSGGILPVMLVCAVVFAATIFIGSLLGGGNMPWGGIGAGNTAATTQGTPGGTGSTGGTQGTQATAPGITPGTGSITPPISYVQWDSAIVEKCLNASVLITVENVGSGSGVIYTQDGYILTNYHVVSNNDNPITVTLYSGEELPATYIYGDESNDIAVIGIEKDNCVYAEISTADVTHMMPVMVIGNALGRGFNTTAGVISAPASDVYFSSTYETMTLIQIDAAVNNGNSGGGLFNTAGQLIGIVNSKLSGTTSSGASIDNTGFAIPMSTVMKCVNDLKEHGYVQGVARLGVAVNNYLTLANGRTYTGTGINVVVSTASEGSARKAGIEVGDILYEINGETISSFETLKKILTAYSVGDTIEVTVLRPTEDAKKQTEPYAYLRKCEEIKLTLKFVEFNPNNP